MNTQTTQHQQQQTELPNRLVITGRSDDLVEVYGDIRLERSKPFDRDFRFRFSNGTALNLYWENGRWNVDVTQKGDGDTIHYPAGAYTGSEPISCHDEAVAIIADQEWLQINGTRINFTEGVEDFYRPSLR